MGAKNYAYHTERVDSGEKGRSVVHVRGLTLSGVAEEQLNMDLMLRFVEQVQKGEPIAETIPQFRLTIDKVTKQLTAKEVQSIYTSYSNDKRYYLRSAHESKLWAYGTTSYD